MTDDGHLGHVNLKVRTLDRAVEFYSDVLGLSVSDRHANFAFLSYGDHHHDLALQSLGEAAAPGEGEGEGKGEIGLYHSAWEVPGREQLRQAHETLLARDVSVTPVDHGISLALYFDDPDGNGVEVYLDTREARDQAQWAGRNERFDPGAL